MTTEVAIMNKSAVALAADSAVTLSTSRGVKVYDSVNKLFELIKGRPVGVMVYNGADIALRPWETVIKVFREDRARLQFGTLDEYRDELLRYIRQQDRLFSEEQQLDAFIAATASEAYRVRQVANNRVHSLTLGGRPTTPGQIRRIVKSEIERFKARVDAWQPGPWAGALPAENRLMTELRAPLDTVVTRVFQQLPISPATRSALKTALLRSFVRYDRSDRAYSGLVMSGFGQDEYYPGLRGMRVKGILKNTLMHVDVAAHDIDPGHTAYVDSFAQGDMVRSFTVGIQDKVTERMVKFWQERCTGAAANARRNLRRALPSLDSGDAKVAAQVLRDMYTGAANDFVTDLSNYQREIKSDLLASIAYLPKDEMGAMAESLVNLTTLKRRVSINDAQTVGGAVNVAVISRGDGFVWLKRKHYFQQELNPTWAAYHSALAP